MMLRLFGLSVQAEVPGSRTIEAMRALAPHPLFYPVRFCQGKFTKSLMTFFEMSVTGDSVPAKLKIRSQQTWFSGSH
jgi:hypothetical protein